jgi:Arc/MetJ-type ribon-helix-helix transcriptional regulator
MEIVLTPELEALIQHEIENGRLNRPEEAVQQALSQWEERRRDLIDLIAALNAGDADLEAGRYTEYDDQGLREVGEQIKREGRQRLAKAAP